MIEESSEYQKLQQIYESQAEILSAIKDPEIARCLRILRATGFYPEYLYERHYYHLSTIYMLWKVQAWLEYAKTFSWNNLFTNISSHLKRLNFYNNRSSINAFKGQ
jgi:hypothetical protein